MGKERKAGPPRWILIATAVVGLVSAILVAVAKYYELHKARIEAEHVQMNDRQVKSGADVPTGVGKNEGGPSAAVPVKQWSGLVGTYAPSSGNRLLLSTGPSGEPRIQRGGWSEAWGYADGKWLFSFGNIDLFTIEPAGPRRVKWCVYWRGCQNGFDRGRLPVGPPDVTEILVKQ